MVRRDIDMTLDSVQNSSRAHQQSQHKSNYKSTKRITSEALPVNHRNVVSATDTEISNLNTKRADSVYNKAQRPQTLNDIIKTVASNTYGDNEHWHDDYWVPVTPG